jgi:hypothetical protein
MPREFYTAIVENDALLTDFISCSPIPFCLIVSERFKELLTTLSLPEHKYYELPLSHKGRDVDSYWALQILTPNSIGSMINFDKSNFFLKDLRTNKREKLELSSELELQKIKNNLLPMQDFYCTSYTFKDGYLGQYDLFHHGWFDVDYYISELARKKILDMELSGVKIKESRMLKFNQRHNQPLQQMPSE